MEGRRIRVLLVEDDGLVRKLLCSYLVQQDDITVVGDCGDGLDALDATRRGAPDVVVMDVAMPCLNGDVATRMLIEAHPDLKVIALTGWCGEDVVARMVEAGARGYMLKAVSPEELTHAIREVAAGGVYLSPEVASRISALHPGEGTSARSHEELLGAVRPTLAPRERDIVRLIAQGHRSQDIATQLLITVKSVRSYREEILAKLGLHSIAELTLWAVHNGLVALKP